MVPALGPRSSPLYVPALGFHSLFSLSVLVLSPHFRSSFLHSLSIFCLRFLTLVSVPALGPRSPLSVPALWHLSPSPHSVSALRSRCLFTLSIPDLHSHSWSPLSETALGLDSRSRSLLSVSATCLSSLVEPHFSWALSSLTFVPEHCPSPLPSQFTIYYHSRSLRSVPYLRARSPIWVLLQMNRNKEKLYTQRRLHTFAIRRTVSNRSPNRE